MVIVECYKDRELMYRMGFIPDQVEHVFGKSSVLDKMKDEKKVIGIIDQDIKAGKPKYLQDEYAERKTEGKIKLLIWKHDHKKRLIEISPYLEVWLYGVAGRNRILPEKYNLPPDPEKLHVMSLRSGKNMQNFQRFLDALRRTGDDEINTLQEWIREAITE